MGDHWLNNDFHSKFLKPGSRRAAVKLPTNPGLPKQGVFVLGAVMADGRRYVTICNKNNTDVSCIVVELMQFSCNNY